MLLISISVQHEADRQTKEENEGGGRDVKKEKKEERQKRRHYPDEPRFAGRYNLSTLNEKSM